MVKLSFALLSAGLFFVQACSNSDSGKGNAARPNDAGADAVTAPSEAGVDAFNGSCTTARWANVSDACWSCLCGTCADTLNKCNTACVDILKCAGAKHTFVDKAAQGTCEVIDTAQECIANNPEAEAATAALTSLDGCLLLAPGKTTWRACEQECGITYSEDVCSKVGYDAGPGSN